MTIDSPNPLNHSPRMSAKRKWQLLWRVGAFVALIGWITAFGICSAHCALGTASHIGGTHEMELPPCHGGPASSGSDAGSDPTPASSFCFTIKSLSFHVDSVLVNAPNAPALIEPALAALHAAGSDLVASAQFLRQSRPLDFVFTPEVSLGPAFRSHAPPVL